MKKYFWGCALVAFTFTTSAAEIYRCDYAKANVVNGAATNMSASRPAKVELSGDAIKAYRSDGSFIFSPPLTQKKGTLRMADDGSKVYVAAIDGSSFAVSDRISKVTEQWDKCQADVKENEGVKPIANPKHRTLTPSERKAVEDAISDQLKDPYSAKFKHSQFISNGNGEYCGYVNSKNSYGGYVGDTPFLVMITGKGRDLSAAVISFGSEDSERIATLQVCQQIGYF
ncbi:hypothetical protein ACP26C_13585 [Franconibacter helveticus 513]|uniref:hypothetical protein n=1 Tax=Franconibacter helveticus TaxID=357240 RepID=UPI000568611F|nr:hypothetical protein [Franconibacter helveticus]